MYFDLKKKNLHFKAHATCSIPFIYVNYSVNPWTTWKISDNILVIF